MAGDARALLPDGLLGNLDQYLLPFFQQVGDERLLLVGVRPGANVVATSTTASPLIAVIAWPGRTLGLTLLVANGWGCSTNFGAPIGFGFRGLVVLFFVFFIGAVDFFPTLFGGDYFIFIDICNLGNPAIGEPFPSRSMVSSSSTSSSSPATSLNASRFSGTG